MIELRDNMQVIGHQHADHGLDQPLGLIERQRAAVNSRGHGTCQLIHTSRLTANRHEPLIFLINPGWDGVTQMIPDRRRHRRRMAEPMPSPKQESHQPTHRILSPSTCLGKGRASRLGRKLPRVGPSIPARPRPTKDGRPYLILPRASSGLGLTLAPPNRRRGQGQRTEAEAVGRRLGNRGDGDEVVRGIPIDRPEAGV